MFLLNALNADNAKHAFRFISNADWGPLLERNSKRAGAFLALIFAAGFMLGSVVHQWNDEIAGFVVTILGLKAVADGVKAEPKPEPAEEPAEEPAAAIQTDATEQAMADRQEAVIETLKTLKVAELRRVARLMGQPREFYRTARKAALLDELCYQASTLQLLDLEIVLGRLTNA